MVGAAHHVRAAVYDRVGQQGGEQTEQSRSWEPPSLHPGRNFLCRTRVGLERASYNPGPSPSRTRPTGG